MTSEPYAAAVGLVERYAAALVSGVPDRPEEPVVFRLIRHRGHEGRGVPLHQADGGGGAVFRRNGHDVSRRPANRSSSGTGAPVVSLARMKLSRPKVASATSGGSLLNHESLI